jgi:hypothetical protein
LQPLLWGSCGGGVKRRGRTTIAAAVLGGMVLLQEGDGVGQ